jgi:hypothetical protein
VSTKALGEKLQIKENYTVLLVNAPTGYEAKLGKLPSNVRIIESNPVEPVDVVQVFVSTKKEMEVQLKRLKAFVKPKGLLWVIYPKGASKASVDVNRDVIFEFGKTIGLQAVAIVSVDDKWSALRLKHME